MEPRLWKLNLAKIKKQKQKQGESLFAARYRDYRDNVCPAAGETCPKCSRLWSLPKQCTYIIIR